MTKYQSMTVAELKKLVKDTRPERGVLSKLSRKQQLITYLTEYQQQGVACDDNNDKEEQAEEEEEEEEDAVAAAAAIAADRNAKRPKGADAGDVTADKRKKKPKANKKFDWRNSAAKKYLKKCFKDGVIPLTYPTDEGGVGPHAVWDEHCKDHPSFKGMVYDTTFANRLRAVKNDSASKITRATADEENLQAFRAKHPKQSTNALGEPRWEGSEAQCLLKSDLEVILKLPQEDIDKQLEPKVLYSKNEAYSVFSLPKFRDHIYQEIRRRRFMKYSEAEKNRPSKHKVMEE
jgi:hypothetical protein